MPYGRTILPTSIANPTRVSADGCPRYKVGGVVVSLATLTAASGSDTTLPDGSVVKANQQFLRYGQILTKITTQPVQTLTGTATGGTFTITLTRPDTQQQVTTAALAATATAAQVLTALQAVMGPNQVASATGGALGTGAVTVTFNNFVPIMAVNGASLTGGTVTPAVSTAGTTNGQFGPYDPGASDGRQTLTRGECFILDELWLATPSGSFLPAGNETMGGVFDAGYVFKDRVLQSGAAAHTLALGPTLAEFLAAFPAVQLVEQ